ncbi:DUF1801 domain-containing protein [Aequorivita sp. Q41]|uniref:DUF1801 domain-containing protein n=1 Tax=Aequorivita sp. Q41 TaxID=3153300 RepID=UPI003242BC6C
MQSQATTADQYIAELPEERKEILQKLREIAQKNLPKGFKETMQYGMISYVVPHSIYPAGYHCKPTDALLFMSIASQKNYISFYHSGLYSDPKLMDWFVTEYPKHLNGKLDMGKSCVRFKNEKNIPYTLLGELITKITVNEWIEKYEKTIKP